MPVAAALSALSGVALAGPASAGKCALARALGAVPAPGSTRCFSWRARALQVVREPQQLGCDSSSTAAVVVLVFDLTRKESFEAALAQWSFASARASHTLLVGTKLDLAREREVFHAEALQAAEMQFDGAYIEVSALHAPFTGVDEVERVLQSWTCATDDRSASAHREAAPLAGPSPDALAHASESAPLPPSPVQDTRGSPDYRSPSRAPCLRASVWLYDPTEDHPPSPEHDVKLRPISRALFEIRGAAHDKMKAAAKYREREGSQLLQRSKYYGPTESSRHMRWHEEQKRLAAMTKSPPRLSCIASTTTPGHVRPRSASHGARSYDREHERLASKSFVQPTELLRQRKLELLAKKALVLAASSSRSGAAKSAGTRSLQPSHAVEHHQRQQQQQEQERTKKSASAAPHSARDDGSSRHEKTTATVPSVAMSRSPPRQLLHSDAAVASQHMTLSDARTSPRHHKDLLVDTAVSSDCVMAALLSPGADCDAALPTPVPLAHLHSPVSPVASPRRERRATIGHVPCSVSTAAPDDVSVNSPSEPVVHAAASASGSATDVASTETVADADAAASSASALRDALPATAPTASPAFDWSAEIDDMLDYFDGVTLPI